jgi:hypothetical protein
MHLDCVFSIIGDDVCIMMDEMMGEESPTRRLVDEWVQVSGCARTSDGCIASVAWLLPFVEQCWRPRDGIRTLQAPETRLEPCRRRRAASTR